MRHPFGPAHTTVKSNANAHSGHGTQWDPHAARRSPEFGVEWDIIYIAHCENAQIHNSHGTHWASHPTQVKTKTHTGHGTHWAPRLTLVKSNTHNGRGTQLDLHTTLAQSNAHPSRGTHWDPHAAIKTPEFGVDLENAYIAHCKTA